LILTNTYFVGSPSQATVTVQDSDDATANIVTVAPLNAPVSIDYQPTTNSLIVSVNLSQESVGGEPVNFARVDSSGTSNAWSTLHGMGVANDEIKLAIVKASTNGWTQGDMYFGTAQVGKIGKIKADGSSVNTNWATLPGETNFLGGSLYFDQTGVFGNDLIVVTGRSPTDSLDGGAVWRVNASSNATLIAQIDNPFGTGRLLEGVLTVPNDLKYGPWAGKILAGQEQSGLICSVEANGTVTTYNLGFGAPEDLRLIPSGQSLYCLDFPNNRMLKVPALNFAAFVGDILVVDEGRGCALAGLYVVHWEGGWFVVRQIPIATSELEQVTFAPIDIPALP